MNLGHSFLSGQVYVALSRCRSLEGIVLNEKISRSEIKIDKKALEFAKKRDSINFII